MPDPAYCVYCTQPFTPNSGAQRYCSRDHKERDRKRRKASQRICPGCGQPFVRLYGYGRTKFCCESCAQITFAKQRGRGYLDLIARVVDAPVRATDEADYLRSMRYDPCSFCLGVEQSRHVDHIVPRSEGGSDQWDNRTCLCQPCNSRKSATPMLHALARNGIHRTLSPLMAEWEAWGPEITAIARRGVLHVRREVAGGSNR